MAFTMEGGLSGEGLAAAAELDIAPGNTGNPALRAVINDMLRPDSLPPGWEAQYDSARRRREYVNRDSGEVQYTHPLLSYYRGASYMETGGYRQLQTNETDQPPAPQEILDMCTYLGITASADDPYVTEVARLAISAPLPPHWTEGEDDEGNPLFTNRQTGQSQPSHPLDPYFLELIKRRRRELDLRSDGVGIRSALAAKRLAAIGVPGIRLPPELQDTGGGGGMRADDLDEEEDAAAAARNFGPLLTIEEAEDEGRDEDEDGGRRKQADRQQKQQPPQQKQQQQPQQQRQQQQLAVEDFEDLDDDPPPPPAAAAAAAEAAAAAAAAKEAEAERLRKQQEEEEEEERQRQQEEAEEMERAAEKERQRQREEEEKEREAEAERQRQQEEEEERERQAEAERRRRQQQEEEEREREAEAERRRIEEEEKEKEREAETARKQPIGKEAQRKKELEEEEEAAAAAAAAMEAARQRMREQAEKRRLEAERLKKQQEEEEARAQETEAEAAARRLREQEEREKKEKEKAAREAEAKKATADAERLRLSDGDDDDDDDDDNGDESEVKAVAAKEKEPTPNDSAREEDEEEEEPQPLPKGAARVGPKQGPSSFAGDGGKDGDGDEKGEEPAPPTLAAGISGLGSIRQALSLDLDSRVSSTAQLLLPPPKAAAETAAAMAAAAATDGDDDDGGDTVTLAPHPPPPPPEEEAGERLVLGSEPAVTSPRSEAARGRGKRRTDDDEYGDDFDSYCSGDFESYASSQRASRDGRRSAGAARPETASRPGTSSQQLAAAAAAAEKLPSRTPTPPPLAAAAADGERGGSVLGNGGDDDEYGDAVSTPRLPSPPGAPPPVKVAPRRLSPGGSRSGSRDSRRGGGAAAGPRSVVPAADEEDEADGGAEGDDEGDGDGDDKAGRRRQQAERRKGDAGGSAASEEDSDGDGEAGEEEREEDEAGATIREQAAAAANRAAAAAAEFDAKFPPLPVPLDDRSGGGMIDLRRSRSFTDVETGRLQKQLSAIDLAVRAAAAAPAAAAAATAGSGAVYAVSKLPSGNLELLQSRVYGSVGAASAGAAAAAALAAAAAMTTPPRPPPPSRERIRVAVRARPVPGPGEPDAWLIDPASRTVRLKDGAASLTHRHISADRVYCFDTVLGPGSTTKQLWAAHVVPLMDASLSGVNTTVFAYGQTGSGKTYTMFGSDGQYEDGAVAMSLTYLFKALETLHKIKAGSEEYTVKISMLELYNEQLRDLLAPGGGPYDRLGRPSGAPLALQDDPRVGVRVSGLEEHPVSDVPAAMSLVQRGAVSRSVGSTAMNEVSSRSHTIVRMALETRDASSHELVHTSLVSFVDLAGSERLAKTGSRGARFVEGTNINISLLMLGTVVSKLAEGRAGEFIPYRNSKLTRLLQPCLGGNSKTAIIATINPSADHVEETFNTLGFATRAMDVVNQVSVNSYVRGSGAVGGALSGAAAAALQKQVATLKAELAALRKEAGGGGGGLSGTLIFGAGLDGGGGGGGGGSGGNSSSYHNQLIMAGRLARLEIDKARLLDRLEVLTGRPVGDVYDDLPPTPPDLNLQPSRPQGRSGSSNSLLAAAGGGGGGAGAANTTPLMALRSIARIACVGRSGGSAAAAAAAGGKAPLMPRQNEQIPPEEVVAAVRDMRAERDELRRRDSRQRQELAEAGERVAALEPYMVLAEQVKEVVGMLENILGPSPLAEAGDDSDPATAASNQAARLAENVQAVSTMYNELAALQRQLATSEAMTAVAGRRADEAEAALQRAASAAAAEWAAELGGPGSDARLKNLVEHLNSQLTAVRRELDVTKAELARWRGLAGVAPEVAGPGVTAAMAAAVAAAAAAAAAGNGAGGDDGEGDPARRLLNPAALNVGSFAIRRAREAMVAASALESRCSAAEAERDELRERLQALEEAVAAAPGGRAMLSNPVVAGGVGAAGGQRQWPASMPGQEGGGGDPPRASRGGPGGQQRFEQLRTHVSSLSQDVSALTRERDSLLAMVLRMQAPAAQQPNGPLAGDGANGRPMGNLLYGNLGMGHPFGNNVFSSVPLPSGPVGMGMGGLDPTGAGMAGARGHNGGGNPMAASAVDPGGMGMGAGAGMGMWEMDPGMAAALRGGGGGGSPVNLKPLRGRVPHRHHHHRHLRDPVADGYSSGGGGGRDLSNRPEFSARDAPLEAKHRVNRLRDRASRLDAPLGATPSGMGVGMDVGPGGLMGKGMGIPGGDQDPVLYGHRDAEVYALKRKLVLAEKARSEVAARAQAEIRNMQFRDLINFRADGVGPGLGMGPGGVAASSSSAAAGGASVGLSAQMALAAANRDYRDQARSHAAEMRQLEVVHEENLAATRAEAAAVFNQLMEENNRLKIILAAGAGGPGGGMGGAAAAEFQLRALGGFGARDGGGDDSGGGMGASRAARSPPRRGPSHLSPLRGSNLSPLRSRSSSALQPGLTQQQQQQQGGGPGGTRSERSRVGGQRR